MVGIRDTDGVILKVNWLRENSNNERTIIMKITDIKIRKICSEQKLRAVVSVTLDDCLAIHEIRLIQDGEHLFAAMPNRRSKSEGFRDIVHPINSEFRNKLERLIIRAYKEHTTLILDAAD